MKTETKHTPGPWVAYKSNTGAIHIKPESSYLNQPIAAACPCESMEANAHLIAAAPELLETLKRCLDYMVITSGERGGLKDDCRAAISKAEGRAE